MTIVEALKKSKKIHRRRWVYGEVMELPEGDPPSPMLCSGVNWAPRWDELVAEDWEPILDRKEEIAERWASSEMARKHWETATEHRPVPFLRAMILGALQEYESGIVEAHIKEHERLNP